MSDMALEPVAEILAVQAVCPDGHLFDAPSDDVDVYSDEDVPVVQVRCPRCDRWFRGVVG